MRKLYIVRLTKEERVELQGVVKKLKGTGQKVRRAQILLKADADGPNWTDERIAEAFSCRTRTVERLRQRFVEQGFEEALNRVERKQPPVAKLLTGDQEAHVIATRLGSPRSAAAWSPLVTGASASVMRVQLSPQSSLANTVPSVSPTKTV